MHVEFYFFDFSLQAQSPELHQSCQGVQSIKHLSLCFVFFHLRVVWSTLKVQVNSTVAKIYDEKSQKANP